MYSWINASAQLAPVVKACFSRKEVKIAQLALKIPSEIEVAPRYRLLTLLTLRYAENNTGHGRGQFESFVK